MDPQFPASPREMYMYKPPQMNGHSTPTRDRSLPMLPERNPDTQLGKRMSSMRSSKSSRGSVSSDRPSPPPSPVTHQHQPIPSSPVASQHHQHQPIPSSPVSSQHHQQQQSTSGKKTYQENKPFSYAVGVLNPKQAAQLHVSGESVLRVRDASPHNGRHVVSETLTVAEDYARFTHNEDSVFQDQNGSSSIYQKLNCGRDRAISAPNGLTVTRGSYVEDKGNHSPANGNHSEPIYGKFVQPGNQNRPKLTYVPPPVVPPLIESCLEAAQQVKQQTQLPCGQQPVESRMEMRQDVYHQSPQHQQVNAQQHVQACCQHAASARNHSSAIMSPKASHKKRSVHDPCPPLPPSATIAPVLTAAAVVPPQLPSRHTPSPPPPPPPPQTEQASRSRSSVKRSNAPSPTPLVLHSQYYDSSHSAQQQHHGAAPIAVAPYPETHAQPYAQSLPTHDHVTQSNGRHPQAYIQHAQHQHNSGQAAPVQGRQSHHPQPAYGQPTQPFIQHIVNQSPAWHHHHHADHHAQHRVPPSFAPPPPAPPPPPVQAPVHREPVPNSTVLSHRTSSPARASHQRQPSAATLEQLALVKLRSVNEPTNPTNGSDDSGAAPLNVKLRPTPGKFGNIYSEEETTLPPPPPPDDFDELPPPPPPPELLAHDVSGLALASAHPPHLHMHHQEGGGGGAAPLAAPTTHTQAHHLAGEANSSQIHQQPAPPPPVPAPPPQHQQHQQQHIAGTNRHTIATGSLESYTSSLERLIAESVANMDFEIPDDIDLSQCPGLVEINKHTPNWKKDMIEKKNQEKIEEYVKNILRQREQEAKWKNVPEWKRKILQKKEEEEQQAKTAPPEKDKKPPAETKPADKEKKPSKKAPVPAPPPKDDFVPPKPKGDIVPAALSIDPEELAAMPPWKRELLFKRDKVPITFSNEFNPEDEDGSAQGHESSDAS